MKKLLAVTAIALIVWLSLRGRESHTVVPPPVAGQETASSLSTRSPRNTPEDPRLSLLGMQVPPVARPGLLKAIKCAQLIERQRRSFAPHSHGENMLIGLQRKLFLDDYAYAALQTGELDPAGASAAYDRLTAGLRAMPEPAVEEPLAGAPPIPNARMREKYEAMLESPGHSNVWNAVAAFDPEALTTDMFKDALTYVALQTEAKNLAADEQMEAERRANAARKYGNTTRGEADAAHYESVAKERVSDISRARGVYAEVFARRATENHGLAGETVIQALNNLDLPNAGPELTIPGR